MVHPLVQHGERTLDRCQVGDAVLRKHSHAEGIDQFRDSVIDLGINVVGTSGKDDAVSAGLLQIVQDFLAFVVDCLAAAFQFLPAGIDSSADLISRNAGIQVNQLLLNRVLTGEGNKWALKTDVQIPEILDIVLDIHRIGSDDGAVVVIAGILELLSLIRHAGIEDGLDPLRDQPFNVTVGDLGRVAFRFGRNGFDPQLIDPMRTGRREDDPVLQFCEERMPEGIQLIHIQDTRDTDDAALRLILRKGLSAEQEFLLEFIEIRQVVLILLQTQSALAAVAGDELPASGEPVDGQAAVVGAALALGVVSGISQGVDLVDGQHGRLLRLSAFFVIILMEALPGDQARAERTHDAGDIRTDGFTACGLLERAKYAVIVKCAALHNNVAAELGRI